MTYLKFSGPFHHFHCLHFPKRTTKNTHPQPNRKRSFFDEFDVLNLFVCHLTSSRHASDRDYIDKISRLIRNSSKFLIVFWVKNFQNSWWKFDFSCINLSRRIGKAIFPMQLWSVHQSIMMVHHYWYKMLKLSNSTAKKYSIVFMILKIYWNFLLFQYFCIKIASILHFNFFGFFKIFNKKFRLIWNVWRWSFG